MDLSFVYLILVKPIEILFDVIFCFAYKYTHSAGLSIITLSFIVNILVLPLYRKADYIQKLQKDKEDKMKSWKKHIKTHFNGDEQMMVLSAYYEECGYKPISVLLESITILLEIPFFMAAFVFLSSLDIISGASFLFLKDLSQPDGLIRIGGWDINMLPFIMTIINIVSATMYSEKRSKSSNVKLYVLAIIFLIILYKSPSGLVFYWILNNFFSLIKNIVDFFKKKEVKVSGWEISNWGDILPPGLFLTLLIGVMIPSQVISSSTVEFINIYEISNPVKYIIDTVCIATGTFVLWLGVIYLMSGKKLRGILLKATNCMCLIAVVDYMFFGNNTGILNSTLVYQDNLDFSKSDVFINFFVIALIIFVFCKIPIKRKVITLGCFIGITSILGMSVPTLVRINKDYGVIKSSDICGEEIPKLHISRYGNNVVIIMIDAAVGAYVPYILEEKPELKEKFVGFTFYPNTISHGRYTHYGAPGLFGGYEYTPNKMNVRSDESLESKHDEALKVLPVLFYNEGYKVEVYDLPYLGYEIVSEHEVFKDYPEIRVGNFADTVNSEEYRVAFEDQDKVRRRNFFCYGIMKVSPVLMQKFIYNGGLYNATNANFAGYSVVYGDQIVDGISKAYKFPIGFWHNYELFHNLSEYTEISEEKVNRYIELQNYITHDALILQKPEYVPCDVVDNTMYDSNMMYIYKDQVLHMDDVSQVGRYHVNICTYLQLGEWLDYLKEEGVYDNTRIIIVADHGRGADQFEGTKLADKYDLIDVNPVLLVKDFNARGEFVVSNEFMTNADVPSLAVATVVNNPINPFTGNIIDGREKNNEQQIVFMGNENFSSIKNKNIFSVGDWYTVSGNDILNPMAWEYIGSGW